MMMSVMTSFSQVYVVHVDTVVHFEHPASMTTLQAMKTDNVTYLDSESGVTDANYTVDFNKMTFTVNFFNGTVWTGIIKTKTDTSERFDFEIITENGNLARVFVDKGQFSYEGYVMYVRWNVMKNGTSMTKGWASRNIIFKENGGQ